MELKLKDLKVGIGAVSIPYRVSAMRYKMTINIKPVLNGFQFLIGFLQFIVDKRKEDFYMTNAQYVSIPYRVSAMET